MGSVEECGREWGWITAHFSSLLSPVLRSRSGFSTREACCHGVGRCSACKACWIKREQWIDGKQGGFCRFVLKPMDVFTSWGRYQKLKSQGHQRTSNTQSYKLFLLNIFADINADSWKILSLKHASLLSQILSSIQGVSQLQEPERNEENI